MGDSEAPPDTQARKKQGLLDGTPDPHQALHRAQQMLQAQNELSNALATTSGLDEALPLYLNAALKISGVKGGLIHLIDESAQEVHVAVSRGLPPDFVDSTFDFQAWSPAAKAIMAGDPVYAPDRLPGREGIHAVAIIPVRCESEIVASLSIFSQVDTRFPGLIVRCLETTANQIGRAVVSERWKEARTQVERELEEQRMLSLRRDRLISLGEMSAGMAHELNQPLLGIRGSAEHILICIDRGWELSHGKIRSKLSAIVEQADRMSHIIEHVRTFARESGKIEVRPTDLNDVIRSALALLKTQLRMKGIRLECRFGCEIPNVLANPFSVEEVLINLLTNARDAIQTRRSRDAGLEDAFIKITSNCEERGSRQYASATVQDSGEGVPEGLVERVFEPFFTTKAAEKGTGLGLSISKSVVESFGGNIEIAGTGCEGTTVIVRLPVKQAT